jgi:diaminopimelate decarboxylase
LNRVNVGSGHSKEYRKEYDEQAYLHVWQHFKEDIDRFGYAF